MSISITSPTTIATHTEHLLLTTLPAEVSGRVFLLISFN